MKVLSRKTPQTDAEWIAFKENFLAEAQNLSKAQHRNVVQVFYIEELADSIRFCMAYCPGGSLQATYEAGPMPLDRVRKVGTEVSFGLQALHSRGMLHRDIKPGNVLLDGDGTAKLGDFGLVTDRLILGYGSQAGYRNHIAYEVWQGGGTSTRTDVWALGMTLYRLLHGQAWYEESPAPNSSISQGGFADTLCWLPHVPKTWRRAIRKMLNDDSSLRFASASAVLNALSKLPTSAWQVVALDANAVRWEQTKVARLRVVEWDRRNGRSNMWKAWSEPRGVHGRPRSLDGSPHPTPRAEAERELTRFFAG